MRQQRKFANTYNYMTCVRALKRENAALRREIEELKARLGVKEAK